MQRSASREAFLARMAALEEASQSGDLQAHAPVPADDDPSRLLRNGLAVVGFAAFEDFFISRTKELLGRIDPVKLPFGKLPLRLQSATTWGAMQTLIFRARLEKDAASRLALIQDHASHLASTGTSTYRLSPLSFAPQGSNLGEDDIEGALKSLMVEWPMGSNERPCVASRIWCDRTWRGISVVCRESTSSCASRGGRHESRRHTGTGDEPSRGRACCRGSHGTGNHRTARGYHRSQGKD